jgi:hypothetical protein
MLNRVIFSNALFASLDLFIYCCAEVMRIIIVGYKGIVYHIYDRSNMQLFSVLSH